MGYGCTPSRGSVCGPQYDIRYWTGAQGNTSDAEFYNITKVVQGQLISAAKYQELNDLIEAESVRRISSGFVAIDPHDSSHAESSKRLIDADQYNELAKDLTGIAATGPQGLVNQCQPGTTSGGTNAYNNDYVSIANATGLMGNGSNSVPGLQVPPPPADTINIPVVPGTNNNTNQVGMVMRAYENGGIQGFNDLIDSLIFAGQQCYCNCNYCSCNCNFCTCNCNFACTCNCNYSDETLKINIEEL